MRPVLLALALLPGATAMGRYYEGCTVTPNGHEIKVFDLDDVCGASSGATLSPLEEECTDDTTYLLKCYDYCRTWCGPGGCARPVEYTWADIGYDSPSDSQGRVCGHSEPVPCYCATACPELLGGDQGLIAGPCDADEPLTVDTGGADSVRTAPPTHAPVKE